METGRLSSGSSRSRGLVPEGIVIIPAGKFVMDSADFDRHAWNDEKLQHVVYLDEYAIDIYPCYDCSLSRVLHCGRTKDVA